MEGDVVIGWRALRAGVLIALTLAPSALVAVALLRVSEVEPVSAPDVILNGIVVAASLVLLLGFAALFLSLALGALFFRAPWAKGLVAYASGERARAGSKGPLILLTAGAGLVVSLSVALPGWSSLSQSLLRLKSDWEPLLWTLVATSGLVGSLMLIVPLLNRRRGALSGVKAIAAALLAPTVLLSGLEFWHSTAFVPAQLEATITVEPSLRFERSPDGVLNQGIAEVSLLNEGDAGTIVLISNFLICPRADHTELEGASPSDPRCIRGTTPPFGNMAVVEAKGALTHQQVFTWDEDSTVVESLTRLAYARSDKLILGERIRGPFPFPCPESTRAITAKAIKEIYPIIPASRYHSLLSARYLLAYGPGHAGGGRYWITTADDDFSCEWNLSLLRRFGIREMSVPLQEWINVREVAGSSG